MTHVDSEYVQALTSDSTLAIATAPLASVWTGHGRTLSARSPFATKEGGEAEAARQLAFFSQPTAVDQAIVTKFSHGYVGKCIRLKSPDLDYGPDGALVIVLAARKQENGTWAIRVLKRLE